MTVIAFVSLERQVNFKSFNSLMILGSASYALYLIHPMVIRVVMIVVDRFLADTSVILNSMIMLFILISSLITGVLLHKFVEIKVTRGLSKLLFYRNK
jgi:peptidoglycan/LPS O-acetylase OafA/YrhL